MAQRNYRSEYQYGSAARKYSTETRRESDVRVRRQTRTAARRRHSLQSLPGILFVAIAFVICALTVVNYVQLQGQLSTQRRAVSSKRVELSDLNSQNDAAYVRITSDFDLSELEEVAIGELGMTYAEEGQIIVYDEEKNDYMRKIGN